MITLKQLARRERRTLDDVLTVARRVLRMSVRAETEVSQGQEKRITEALNLGTAVTPERQPQDTAARPEVPPAIPALVTRTRESPWRERSDARRILVHEQVLDYMGRHEGPVHLRKRMSACLLQLAAWGRTSRVKVVAGSNKGWRRTPLAGTGGSHFYLWWTTAGSEQGKSLGLSSRDIAVRAIREHDLTDRLLAPGSIDAHYLQVPLGELLGVQTSDYFDVPFTDKQVEFSRLPDRARVVQGFPGAGKTTTLLRAAAADAGERVLYLTKSADLANAATGFLEQFADRTTLFRALTVRELLARVQECDAASLPAQLSLAELQKRIERLPTKDLGAWRKDVAMLAEEIRTFGLGRALPGWCDGTAVISRERYLGLRKPMIGAPAEDAARILELLRREAETLADTYEQRVFDVVRRLAAGDLKAPSRMLGMQPTKVVVDEVQDLLPIEYALVVELARACQLEGGTGTELVLAGDEAQTVGDSGFKFGELHDYVHERFARPRSLHLATNLRSPSLIASVVNNAHGLYGEFEKDARPKGSQKAQADDPYLGDLVLCEGWRDPQSVIDVLLWLAEQPDAVVVAVDPSDIDTVSGGHAGRLSESILLPWQVKGLEWSLACVIVPSRTISAIQEMRRGSDTTMSGLRLRRSADGLRVAVSRATERLVLLEVDQRGADLTQSVLLRGDDVGSGAADDRVQRLSPEELRDMVIREESLSPEEFVQHLADEARKLVDTDSRRAIRRARQAVTRLGNPDVPGSVSDEDVRAHVHRTFAYVSFRSFLTGRVHADADAGASARDAVRGLRLSGDTSAADAVDALGNLLKESRPSKRAALLKIAAAGLSSMNGDWAREIRECLLPDLRSLLAEQSDAGWIAEGATPRSHEDLRFICQAADAPEAISGMVDPAVLRWAETLLRVSKYEAALDLFAAHPAQPRAQRVRCYEALGRWAEAAELHEVGGDLFHALRCYREAGEIDRALRCAERADPAVFRELGELRSLLSTAERVAGWSERLTARERGLVQEALRRTCGDLPGSTDAPPPQTRSRM